ncbi:MAG: ParB/RepB/Spo0J family partition protein [Anaerolineae bacterium]|nr:ParB/RepB/Spo0J family partition protein [Anaerolineae bacterium]
MARKSGLGKGLDALMPEPAGEPVSSSGPMLIPISNIVPNPRQPRYLMKSEDLAELAASIREHGIIQPLIVTRDEGEEIYTLIAGERRLRAAKLAELELVPVIMRQVTDQQRLELALIENVQRADLTPLETAEAYLQLSEAFGLSHEEIAQRVGKNRVTVTNTLRLLKLPKAVHEALAEGAISEGHARALLGLPTAQGQTAALGTILKQDLTVRQTEELVRKLCGEKPHNAAKKLPDPEINEIEQRLSGTLGTRVSLHHGKKGGSVVIHYYSDEELNTLIEHLTRE